MSTALAQMSDGLVGVVCVATDAEHRGHGYGEAVTWAAATSAPDLPVVLQASAMGTPVCERMGFEQIGTFTVWEGVRRAG